MIDSILVTIVVVVVCMTAVWCQHAEHKHERMMRGDGQAIQALTDRVTSLELKAQASFDPKAFEELKDKVDTMRVAQGLRGSRG